MPERDQRRPIFTTGRVFGTLALLVAGGLFLLSRACFDVPIRASIDLERKGVPIFQTIKFRHPEQTYAYGIAFRPSSVNGDRWDVRDYETETRKAWAELCPTVDITITDASGVRRMREASRISQEDGWTITNGSQDDRPASVYKFIPFKPKAGERYHVRVSVIKGCAGSNALSPVFFIEMPTAGP